MRGFLKTTTLDDDNTVIGDLHLTDGDLVEVTGIQATAQELRSRLLFFKGTCFADLSEGVPYFQEILIKGVSIPRVREIVRQVIAGHPAIIDVPRIDITLDRATRAATISFDARTNEGLVVSSVDFGSVNVG